MTFQEAVEYAAAKLTTISNNANNCAKLDAQLLVCQACKIAQTKLLAHPQLELTREELTLFESLLTRRSQGEPLAYITGEKEFWSLDFIVNKHVLIPRPETELLVEIALDLISDNPAPRILDLGTGSGAIAVAIAKERIDCVVVATDISEPALDVAKTNVAKHKVSIQFIHSNWYENLANEKYDVIICNPPYIAKDDPNLEQQVAQHEPNHALISENSGLQDLAFVIAGAKRYLSAKGHLIIEHGFQQATAVQQLFTQHEFSQVQTHKDLAGLDRVTSGKIKGGS